jgi:PhnB protein
MPTRVKPIPEGYHAVTPYLIVKDAARAIEFYKKAFGAKEHFRMARPDGKVEHAELQIGDSRVMLADESPEMGAKSPQSIGGTPVTIHLYVADVDGVARKAIDAGAQLMRPIADQFYGDRNGSIADPFGHMWWISTHKEDVPPDEMKRRVAAHHASMS